MLVVVWLPLISNCLPKNISNTSWRIDSTMFKYSVVFPTFSYGNGNFAGASVAFFSLHSFVDRVGVSSLVGSLAETKIQNANSMWALSRPSVCIATSPLLELDKVFGITPKRLYIRFFCSTFKFEIAPNRLSSQSMLCLIQVSSLLESSCGRGGGGNGGDASCPCCCCCCCCCP